MEGRKQRGKQRRKEEMTTNDRRDGKIEDRKRERRK